MNINHLLPQAFFRRLDRIADSRPPDFIIGPADDPQVRRWWVIPRNRWFNIYLHHFMRSDEDCALHDHPWVNLSLLLTSTYVEHTIRAGGISVRTPRRAGDIKLRWATAAHRIELDNGPMWTLFITGPVTRDWGFHCPNGWRHWKEFVSRYPGGNHIGRGCE